jgi:hypothetical protein
MSLDVVQTIRASIAVQRDMSRVKRHAPLILCILLGWRQDIVHSSPTTPGTTVNRSPTRP